VFKRSYIVEMPEHSQTIGYVLTDSPAGPAASTLDHNADSYEKISRPVRRGESLGRPHRGSVLHNVMYWLTHRTTSSACLGLRRVTTRRCWCRCAAALDGAWRRYRISR
jgi:hypothetical protein